MTIRSRDIFIGIGIAAVLAFIAYVFLASDPSRADAALLEELARDAVEECSTSERSTCYEREVPQLYPTFSIPEIFEVVRHIRHIDPQYQFCHVLAHKLGETIVAEDPDAWLDAIPLNPSDGMCSNGFVHGVVGGRFRAEVLDDSTLTALYDDFRKACEPTAKWSPSQLDQAICYHGMGHLYVFITDADLRKALEVCEATTDPAGNRDYRQVCREGVFMQIYQPLEPDDFLMIERMAVKPTRETVRQFCAAYRDVPEYEGACLRESWPFFREEITSGTGIDAFCSGQPNDEETYNCYQSATAIVGRMSLSDPDKAVRACGAIDVERQSQCFIAVATAVLEEDRSDGKRSIALCERAVPVVARECLSTLASRAEWFYGSDTARKSAYCAAFPEDLRSLCR